MKCVCRSSGIIDGEFILSDMSAARGWISFAPQYEQTARNVGEQSSKK